VLVKPATVIGWHRKGFHIYWRWRSRRSGRSKTHAEIRDLIRRMSSANPLWGAPRIRGKLLKLGIEVSQATVGMYPPWGPKTPSPIWRSFLHNHLTETVAIDMFIVATATFRIHPPPMSGPRDRLQCRVQPSSGGKIVAFPQVGGLHHRYEHRAA
jgi:putative transposase